LSEFLHQHGVRDMKILKESIIEILEHIRKNHPEIKDIPEEIDCSKHWWYNYRHENAEINKIWKNLPLTRTAKVKAKERNSNQLFKERRTEETEATNLSSSSSSSETNMFEREGICEINQQSFSDEEDTEDDNFTSSSFEFIEEENNDYSFSNKFSM